MSVEGAHKEIVIVAILFIEFGISAIKRFTGMHWEPAPRNKRPKVIKNFLGHCRKYRTIERDRGPLFSTYPLKHVS